MSENNIPHIVDQGSSYIGNPGKIGFIQPPPPHVGCWIIGRNVRFYVEEKVTDEQIKATEQLLGWKWQDGDFNSQCK